MPTQYRQVFSWHLIFCLFYYQLRASLQRQSWEPLRQLVDPSQWYLILAGFLVLFLYAAGTYFVLHRYHQRPWYILGPALLLSTVLAVAVRYLLEEQLAPVLIGFRNYPEGTSYLTYFLDNLYYALLHGAIGAIVFLLQQTRFREAQRQELLVQNQQTELAYLRSQINPHFLFNTLNNIYSLFFQKSDLALQAVERLTVMLRYGLYEQAERVPLSQEVEHLLNFIELEKMRYNYEPHLEIRFPEQLDHLSVPPLLLLTFVENAFKHGDLRQPVTIDLNLQGNQLSYKVVNQLKQQQVDKVGGIGLGNLQKRLALIYGDQQEMTYGTEGNTFTAQLKIKAP